MAFPQYDCMDAAVRRPGGRVTQEQLPRFILRYLIEGVLDILLIPARQEIVKIISNFGMLQSIIDCRLQVS